MVSGMPNEFKFVDKRVDILIPLRTNITVFNGNSGTGKTYLFKYLKLVKKNYELGLPMSCNFDLDKVHIIITREELDSIYNVQNSIIFIDRFDFLKDNRLFNFIANSSNLFILAARMTNDMKGTKKLSSYRLVTGVENGVLKFRAF